MPRPSFFFVGHPRSGSGLLDGYLAGHPDIFMARKELHYFGADLRYHDPPRSLENYLAHFSKAPRSAKVIGESSTWMLISARAAAEVHAFTRGDAKILMTLREPASWLQSLHSHLVFTGDEDIADFGAALAAEPDRQAGRRLPPWSIPANATHYRAHTAYAAQVRRYLELFGPERVKVLILDDLQRDPEGTYDEVLRWLGLRTDFPGRAQLLAGTARTRNSNRTVRSAWLRGQVNQPARRRVLEGVDPAPIPGVGLLIRAARRLNIRYADRPPADPALVAALRTELQPEVEALEALLGRPLPRWRR